MDRVYSADEKPFEDGQHAAIAIGVVDVDQRHIGMLHHESDSNAVLMLHLEWHHRLKNELPDRGFLWVNPAIHRRRLVQVAAVCRKVWKANRDGGIPYAFSQPSDCFDPD